MEQCNEVNLCSIVDVTGDLCPSKSQLAYDKAWKDFKDYSHIKGKPSGAHLVDYLIDLHQAVEKPVI